MAVKDLEFLEFNGDPNKYAFVPVPATDSVFGGIKAELTDEPYVSAAKKKADGKLYLVTDETLSVEGAAADAKAVGVLAEYEEYTKTGDPIVEGSAANFTDTYYHNATGTYTNDHGVQYRFLCQELTPGNCYYYENQEWTIKNSNFRLFEVTGDWTSESSVWKQVFVSGDIFYGFRCPEAKAGVTYIFQMSYHIFAGGTYPKLYNATATKKPVAQKVREMETNSNKLLKGYWGPNEATTTGSTMYNALGVSSETEGYYVGRLDLVPGATYRVEQQNDPTINNNARCFRNNGGTIMGPQLWATNKKQFEFVCPDDGMKRTLQVVFNRGATKIGERPVIRRWITEDSLAGEIIEKRVNAFTKISRPKLRVLAVGNSYTLDSWSYVPPMLKERGIDIDMSIYYRGSGTLQHLVDEWESTTSHTLYHWDTEIENKWVNVGAVTPKSVLELGYYDIICFQQGSTASIDSSTYAVFSDILNRVQNLLTKPSIMAWLMTYTRSTADDKAAALANHKAHIEKYPFGMYFPVGTAIFNARTNATLAAVSTGGNLWASDGVHLEEGLPCYIAACTICETLFRKFYPRESILGDAVRPDWATTTAWGVANRQGTTDVGLDSEENIRLGHKAAIIANNIPFAITTIS